MRIAFLTTIIAIYYFEKKINLQQYDNDKINKNERKFINNLI